MTTEGGMTRQQMTDMRRDEMAVDVYVRKVAHQWEARVFVRRISRSFECVGFTRRGAIRRAMRLAREAYAHEVISWERVTRDDG